jgi:serine phosphatase RsbU (regulator of sigma subunit)
LIRNSEHTIIKPTRSSLGGYDREQKKRFRTSSLQTQTGDCFYMFSDGYADQFGGDKHKKYMSRRLHNVLREVHHLPMEQQKEELLRSHHEWKGTEEQVDDISLIGIRV